MEKRIIRCGHSEHDLRNVLYALFMRRKDALRSGGQAGTFLENKIKRVAQLLEKRQLRGSQLLIKENGR